MLKQESPQRGGPRPLQWGGHPPDTERSEGEAGALLFCSQGQGTALPPGLGLRDQLWLKAGWLLDS